MSAAAPKDGESKTGNGADAKEEAAQAAVKATIKEGVKVYFEATFDGSKQKWKATRVAKPGNTPFVAEAAQPKQKLGQKRKAPSKSPASKKKTKKSVPLDDARKEAIVKQVSYYLSAENLKKDEWMRQQIEDVKDKEGFKSIALTTLLQCSKLSRMVQGMDEVETAFAEAATAPGEHVMTVVGKNMQRRVQFAMAELPPLVVSPVMRLSEVADGVDWKQIRAAFLAYDEKLVVRTDGEIVCFDPDFKEEAGKAVEGGLKLNGAVIAQGAWVEEAPEAEKLRTELLEKLSARQQSQQSKKRKPNPNANKKNRESSLKTQWKNDGEVKLECGKAFPGGRNEIYNHVAGFYDRYKNKVALAADDFALIKELIGAHPRASEKLANLKSIYIDLNTAHAGPNKRCFFVVREDGSTDDVSMIKAINGIEAAKK